MDAQEKEFYQSLLIIVGIAGAILAYFIITAIRYQRRSIRMNKEKIRAEIDTMENERRRIAADLHDELGPLLSAVKLQINHLETDLEEDKMLIEKASNHIDNMIRRLREISNNLMPNTLLRKGLKTALSELAESSEQAFQLKIKLVCEEDLKLSQDKEINIFRIVQEIIHNTAKHAGAGTLVIQITKDNDKLLLATADNGKGFNYEKKSDEHAGLGLRNLQSRTEIMGGEMTCKTEPGKGTMYNFEIPL
jgi:two-component system, NarL family, sensor kinase